MTEKAPATEEKQDAGKKKAAKKNARKKAGTKDQKAADKPSETPGKSG